LLRELRDCFAYLAVKSFPLTPNPFNRKVRKGRGAKTAKNLPDSPSSPHFDSVHWSQTLWISCPIYS